MLMNKVKISKGVKKLIFLTILMLGMSLSYPSFVSAQGMMGNTAEENSIIASQSDDHTTQGEAEGKIIWEKLQAKEINCEALSDNDFHSLGMHFMGVMVGNSHEAMDTMMEQMIGEEGEDQMHIAMGKRMSGCQADAPLPQRMMGGGMMPMMSMMMGSADSSQVGGGENSMMGNFGTNPMGTFGWGFGWIFMILFWGLIIAGVIALVRWIVNQGKNQAQSKSALEILKERYAKGEIDKKEFAEKKKDLVSVN